MRISFLELTLQYKVLSMSQEKYLNDIKDIRRMMDRSSQFLSLSGLSGILAGVYALVGAFIVHRLIANHHSRYVYIESRTFKLILLTAAIVLIASLLTAILFSIRKAKKNEEQIWNATSKRMAINFMIPLIAGGIFSFLLIRHEYYGLIGPVTLIFYGLACVNASKYTISDIRYLGITEIILGLIAVEFPGNSLYFWAIGFGFFHILYGAIMYVKYDRQKQ